MTKINRLTQIPTLDDSDLAVVFQDSSERTRAITIANLRHFIQSTDPNADAFVKAELVGDELILTAHDETQTRIDINLLPEHSVTELSDMPDTLESDHYLKVNEAGTAFVLTPASEFPTEMVIENNGEDVGQAAVLNFTGDISASITEKTADINVDLSKNGFKDNGIYAQFDEEFTTLPKGTAYIYGYTEQTGLPILSDSNPLFVNFGTFAGYDYNFMSLLGSHNDDEGLWAYVANAGAEGKWFKLGCPNDTTKLDSITDTGSGQIITDEERQMLGNFALTEQVMKDNGIIRGIDADFKDVIEKGVTTLLGGWDDISKLPDIEVKEASIVDFGVIGGGGNRLYILCNNHDGYFLFSKDGGYEREWSKIVESRPNDAVGTSPRKTGDYDYQWTKEAMFSVEAPESLTLQNVKDSAISALNIKPSIYTSTVQSQLGNILVLESQGIEEDIKERTTNEDVKSIVESNNDEIITPNPGSQFQLIDSTKSGGYGKNNSVTYFQPQEGTQSSFLLSKLDYGSAWAIHESVDSVKLNLILHESLVEQIYGRDLTGVNELTMLFTGDARGRLGKANQTADQQFIINWNGELIPANNSANEINPSEWVASDDSVTETWSNSVKTVCYSNGMLANRGSAMLRRGDVVYTNSNALTDVPLVETPKYSTPAVSDSGESSHLVFDNSSEFFVMPIIAGGGTFNVMKLFQLFMSRKSQYVEEWGSLKFDQSSDCIGTILKIAYDAAIAEEEKEEQAQNDQIMEGLVSGVIYAKNVTIG